MTATTGLAVWAPTDDTLILIEQVKGILREYRAHLPMTGRQIFYRLVGAHDYAKTEKAYKNLLSKLARARRAGLIPWGAIRDDGVSTAGGYGWETLDDFIEGIRSNAAYFTFNEMTNQPVHIELWCEAQGMVPQMERIAMPFGISVYSSGGFNSVTMKHDAARRFIERAVEHDKPTLVLHVGDHDPSGVSIFENLDDDLGQFIFDYSDDDDMHGNLWWQEVLRCRRIAVTELQADEFDLDSAPPKATDSRSNNWHGETYQVEAMSPDQLASVVTAAIEEEIDADALAEIGERSERMQQRLTAWLDSVDFSDLES